MRWLCVLVVVFTGCVMTLPADDGITADLAAETARLVVQLRHQPAPAPVPAADTCPRCGGTGIIGDMVSIRMQCPDCRGTGKKLKSVLVPECATGNCKVPR